MLIRTLPAESVLARELHGEIADWGVTNWQIAALTDLLGQRFAGRRWRRLPRPVSKLLEKKRPQMPVDEKRRRLARLQRIHDERTAGR